MKTFLAFVALLTGVVPPVTGPATGAPNGVQLLPVGPTPCVNLPVSPLEIAPSSCWVTGPTSVLVAGTDPAHNNDGAVVNVNGQQKTRVAMPGSGPITIDDVRNGHACVTSRNHGLADIDLLATAHPTGVSPCGRPAGRASTPSRQSQAITTPTPAPSPPGPAPPPAASYYVFGDYVSKCGAAATTGCPLYVDGANEPTPPGGTLMVLDFAASCFVPNSSPEVYGTQLFGTTTCTSDDQLVPLAQAFIRGYESTHGGGTPVALLAVGTSNSLNGVNLPSHALTAGQMQASGQAWYTSFVLPLSSVAAAPAPVTIWGANDLEMDNSGNWYGPIESRAWVDAYGAAAGITSGKSCAASSPSRMADYGSDQFLNKQWTTPGPVGWTMADVYHVAWGAPAACAVPEIYYPPNATEWQQLSQAAVAQGLPAIVFSGPMAAGWDNGTLAAADSWNALASATGQSPPYVTVIGALHPSLAAAPTNVVAIASDASATVYWWASDPDGGSPVTGYTVTAVAGATTGPSTTVRGLPPPASATVTGLTNGTAYTFTVTATNAAGDGAPSAPSNEVTPGRGPYHALAPARILDTRTATGGHQAPLGQQETMNVQVAGSVDANGSPSGVPASGVSAVVLNVTLTNPTAPSFLTLWPAGVPRPFASNLNFVAGKTVPNLVEVALGSAGQVSVFNAAGSADVIIDVAGYVSTPTATPGVNGIYNPVVPFRVLDTRYGTGGYHSPVGAGQTINVQVGGVTGSNVPATGVSAIVLNVTVTQPTAPGSFLTVFPMGTTRPVASNLNFVAGQTVPNRVFVKVVTNPQASGGWVSIYNAAGSVHVIVDVAGWFTDGTDATATGSLFVGMTPVRIIDTRNGHGPVGPGGTLFLSVAGMNGVPSSATAVVMNVTVTNPTAPSFLTVWPDGAPQRPVASDLNYTAGLTVPNLVVVKVGANGSVDFYNAAGSTDVIADVVGWYG